MTITQEPVPGFNSMPASIRKLVLANLDKIQECSNETSTEDGYWLYLKSGWSWEGECHCVHEWNVKDTLAAFRSVEPCTCKDCRADAGK